LVESQAIIHPMEGKDQGHRGPPQLDIHLSRRFRYCSV